ncbi:hypothetical protein K458DRAFT_389700 [Lentithecium fluviatile CBS 122367]|uniref:NADH dehydrogenase [ubiquinone] 1 beta subcomplex subunit 4 n=1 Tax=Lentithecium fluviatile CBS 122367 TaxID=1168545 RepID=A0A6G1IZU3_9PLEO|nr:hypothetical protein K458DRAFT_389700 [Lentithecium fluviatile CBS 122367]
MAGFGPKNPHVLHLDPAIVKWNQMTMNRHKHFRWTKRTVWLNVVYVLIVPGILGTAGYMTEGKWEMRGKRRGDLISEY